MTTFQDIQRVITINKPKLLFELRDLKRARDSIDRYNDACAEWVRDQLRSIETTDPKELTDEQRIALAINAGVSVRHDLIKATLEIPEVNIEYSNGTWIVFTKTRIE